MQQSRQISSKQNLIKFSRDPIGYATAQIHAHAFILEALFQERMAIVKQNNSVYSFILFYRIILLLAIGRIGFTRWDISHVL